MRGKEEDTRQEKGGEGEREKQEDTDTEEGGGERQGWRGEERGFEMRKKEREKNKQTNQNTAAEEEDLEMKVKQIRFKNPEHAREKTDELAFTTCFIGSDRCYRDSDWLPHPARFNGWDRVLLNMQKTQSTRIIGLTGLVAISLGLPGWTRTSRPAPTAS